MVLRDLLPGTHWKQLLNLPGANPAAAGVPMDGWENTWEKADACDWDVLLSLVSIWKSNIVSQHILSPKKTLNLLGIIPQYSIYQVKYFTERIYSAF